MRTNLEQDMDYKTMAKIFYPPMTTQQKTYFNLGQSIKEGSSGSIQMLIISTTTRIY